MPMSINDAPRNTWTTRFLTNLNQAQKLKSPMRTIEGVVPWSLTTLRLGVLNSGVRIAVMDSSHPCGRSLLLIMLGPAPVQCRLDSISTLFDEISTDILRSRIDRARTTAIYVNPRCNVLLLCKFFAKGRLELVVLPIWLLLSLIEYF